jgi:hypothetical protein
MHVARSFRICSAKALIGVMLVAGRTFNIDASLYSCMKNVEEKFQRKMKAEEDNVNILQQ